ncbi:unnamed protein product [Nippostrongylus brasiliensis]|uniref:Ground-like domain-containing protein n=1 Tax=Nippostrongylus brasiliensis TaxID=27835 RepID=A0A0N4Y7N8_NIPBR|nr:unnamed protein product [Nippostrongylus brasiliensis]
MFFGGGGGGCGCSAPPPPCACTPPPQPVCPVQPACPQYAPPPPPQYPPQPPPVFIGPPAGYALPAKRAKTHRTAHGVKTEIQSPDDVYLIETAGQRRVRRDTEAVFDPKCNSEILKDIILQNMSSSTATAKRQIQEAATEKVGGRIDVVCSSGTFSYIVNTELYCETEKDGITCFAFRQSSSN